MHYVNKRWTPERIKEFGDYYQTHTLKELSEKFFYSENTCRDLIKRFCLSKRPPSSWEDEDDYLLVGLYIERVSLRSIADKLDKAYNTCRNRINYLKNTGRFDSLFIKYLEENNHRFKG